jgi:hypothetical protein
MARSAYALRKSSGLLKRRFPPIPWDAFALQDVLRPGVPAAPGDYKPWRATSAARFFFEPGALPDAALLRKVVGADAARRTRAVADGFCEGRFLLFSRHVRELGRPADWLLNPFNGARHGNDLHWCDHPTFSAELGDIKEVWEASRFACAYWLVRAYALSGDDRYPAAFWELFESWCRQNPPNRGPNYKCGQEMSIRLFAWCFALFAFWNHEASTPARVGMMVKAIALHAERIVGNIAFAISQKNNHGISEAVGLMTAGYLFPELRGSPRWLETGRRLFEQEALRQIYDDGSYVQHSMNYHRVMLHDCIWAIELARLAGEPCDPEVRRRVGLAGAFLLDMMDPDNGRVPNYGPNDGARVLPLSACDYRDYRATAQAAHYLSTGRRAVADGPWNEILLWLFGADALKGESKASPRPSRRFDAGGYYTLSRDRAWCMIRCHAYRDKPAHVDMLHVDLWSRGENVLSDSGSYKYFSPDAPAAARYFKDIQAHNTIEIDGASPLRAVTRFLWAPWPSARCVTHSAERFVGEHDAYARVVGVVHRREVQCLPDGVWVITDSLSGAGRRRIALRWHLADAPYRLDEPGRRLILQMPSGDVTLTMEGPAGLSLAVHRERDEPGAIAGWQSLYYAERTPRPTLEAAGRLTLPVRITTRIQLGPGGGE